MAVRKASRRQDYWCHSQGDGHPVLYFHGHELISRAEYVGAVGPDDCEPHIATGKRVGFGEARKDRGSKTRADRERMKRM